MKNVIKVVGSVFTNEAMLTQLQLKRLSEHEYSAVDCSLCDELAMNGFWDWVVSLYPLWLAPNLVTVLGIVLNIAASVLLCCYSPDAKQTAPSWLFVLCAASLFLHQTLDATDGKQARRTGTSSPLGELLDHGCDSVSQTFVALQICISMRLGDYPALVVTVCWSTVVLFYCAHWQTYVSGVLNFGKFGVTETEFCIIALSLISGIFGPEVWQNYVLGIELRIWVLFFSALLAIYTVYENLCVVFTGGVGKNGSTVADTSVLFPVIPLMAVIIPAYIIFRKSSTTSFTDHLDLYCLNFGIVAAKITCKLVMAHMTRSELQLGDTIFYGPFALCANQYFDTILPEYPLLVICFVYSLVNFSWFAYLICDQICKYLKISCFTIPYPPPKRYK